MTMKIAIDPGHGMSNRNPGSYDPGACAGGVSEADVALQWALTLKWVLTRHGYGVWMTRDDDRDSDPVQTRDDRAKAAGCGLFLSIHLNSSDSPSARGVETFYRDSRDKELAAIVQRACLDATGSKDRGLKTEGQSQHSRLAVLDFDGPACLLETGFVSNASDRRVLLLRETRLAFAENLAQGLRRKFPPA